MALPSSSLLPDITARKWLDQDRQEVQRQMEVITIHMLSPFLFGCSHQSDKVGEGREEGRRGEMHSVCWGVFSGAQTSTFPCL